WLVRQEQTESPGGTRTRSLRTLVAPPDQSVPAIQRSGRGRIRTGVSRGSACAFPHDRHHVTPKSPPRSREGGWGVEPRPRRPRQHHGGYTTPMMTSQYLTNL